MPAGGAPGPVAVASGWGVMEDDKGQLWGTPTRCSSGNLVLAGRGCPWQGAEGGQQQAGDPVCPRSYWRLPMVRGCNCPEIGSPQGGAEQGECAQGGVRGALAHAVLMLFLSSAPALYQAILGAGVTVTSKVDVAFYGTNVNV